VGSAAGAENLLRAVGGVGGVVAEFVRFTLDDGSEVVFESAESDLVAQHGGPPEVREGGRLAERLRGVAEAAGQVAGSLRSRLAPDEVSLELGLQVSGGVGWFFTKSAGEGTIKVTLTWAGDTPATAGREAGPDPEG
jgi:hypothetical protein